MNNSNEPINSNELQPLNAVVDSVGVNEPCVKQGDIQAVDKVSRELTVKNRVFLQLLANGKKTLEAYRLAGYQGSDHAAYELRSSLKEHLIGLLESQGIDRAGLMSEVKRLLEMPLKETEISLKYKLDLLKLLAKTLPQEMKSDRPKITAFVVNTRIDTKDHSQTVIDTSEA